MNWACLAKNLGYPILIIIFYYLIKKDYYIYSNGLESDKVFPKIRINTMLIISILMGIYCTTFGGIFLWGDIARYHYYFVRGTQPHSSLGIDFVYSFVQKYTSNFDVLVFLLVFITTMLVMITYRKVKDASPKAILLLFFSLFFVSYATAALKQGIACGLGFIAIMFMQQKKWISFFLCSALAITFHEASTILLFLPIICATDERKAFDLLKVVTLIFIIFFFPTFSSYIFSLLNRFMPNLANEASTYMDGSGSLVSDSRFIVLFKGIPYYFITIIGFIKRKKLSKEIMYYDSYLWISTLASILYMASIYSYWMQRYIAFFFFHDAIFLDLISRKSLEKNIFFLGSILFAFFTIRFMIMWYPIF